MGGVWPSIPHFLRTNPCSARFARLFRRFTKKVAPARRNANRFRPTLEALDRRDVPAVWTDATGDGAFGTAGNWSNNAVPASGDYLLFRAANPSLGWVGSTDGVSGMQGTFFGVGIDSSYSGTITFGGAVTVTYYYQQDGGAIAQPTSGTDLTVTGTFNWTGGTLNSSSHLANVTITGSTTTALIQPTSGGTVNLGSSINLSSGAVATMKAGDIAMANNAVLNINDDCGMLVEPGTGSIASVKVQTVGVTQINIKTDAWLQVVSGQFGSAANAIPLDNTGGSFILENGTRAVFGGDAVYPYLQSAGATYIAADATLVAGSFGAKFSGGLLSIKAGTQPQNFEGHIKGDLTFQGGDIRFESPTNDSHTFGTFIVNGDVFWEGGTYHPYVDADTNGGPSDVWKATGNFSISATTPVVTVTAVDTENNVVTATSNNSWYVLRSDGSLSAIGGDPSLSSGWTFDKDPADPKKWWKVKKT